jgi:hypothetical protein
MPATSAGMTTHKGLFENESLSLSCPAQAGIQ